MSAGSQAHLRRLLGASIRIGLLTLGVKVLGVARDVAMAGRYGTSPDMDVFFVAYGLVQFAINVVPANVPSALVPGLVHLGPEGEGRRGGLGRATLVRMVLLCLGLAILLGVGAPSLLALDAAALGPQGPEATRVLWPLLPLLPLFGAQWCLASILQAQGRYTATSLAPALTVAAVYLALRLLPGPPGVVLVQGFLLGGLLEVLWLSGAVFRGVEGLGGPEPRPAEIRLFWAQLGSVVAGSIFMCSTNLVDLLVGARLGSGTVAALSYASRLPSGLCSLAVTALGTAALPQFASLVAQGEIASLRQMVRRSSRLLLAVTLPLAVAFALASGPLTRALFVRDAFGASEAAVVAPIQALYFLQLPFYVLGVFHVRLISAFRRNGLLLGWTVIAAGLNLGLDLLLSRWMGPKGIALSTTCMYLVGSGYMTYWTRRLLREAEVRP